MDAGLAGLIGGVIGATVAGAFSALSAHLTGRKVEKQARIMADAQLEQARMQAQVQLAQAQAQLGQTEAQIAQANQQIQSEHLLQRREARTRVFLEYADAFQDALKCLYRLRTEIGSENPIVDINTLDTQLREAIDRLSPIIVRVGLEGSTVLRKLCSDMQRWLMAHASTTPQDPTAVRVDNLRTEATARDMFDSFLALAGATLESDGVTPVTVNAPNGWGRRMDGGIVQTAAPEVPTPHGSEMAPPIHPPFPSPPPEFFRENVDTSHLAT